jgi:hypothetical protein
MPLHDIKINKKIIIMILMNKMMKITNKDMMGNNRGHHLIKNRRILEYYRI